MVEISHTEPEARDGVFASLVTDGHSDIFGVIAHYMYITYLLPFFIEIFVDNEYFVEFCQEPHAVAEKEGEDHHAQHCMLPGLR